MTKKAKRMLALMDRATTLWHIPVVGRAKGRIIRRVIERHGSARGIEIGALIGYSAILIASAMPPKGRLVCVEVDAFLTWMAQALTFQPVRFSGIGNVTSATPSLSVVTAAAQ